MSICFYFSAWFSYSFDRSCCSYFFWVDSWGFSILGLLAAGLTSSSYFIISSIWAFFVLAIASAFASSLDSSWCSYSGSWSSLICRDFLCFFYSSLIFLWCSFCFYFRSFFLCSTFSLAIFIALALAAFLRFSFGSIVDKVWFLGYSLESYFKKLDIWI